MEVQKRHFERGRMGTFCVGLERCGVVVRVDCTFRPAAFWGWKGVFFAGQRMKEGYVVFYHVCVGMRVLFCVPRTA